MKILFAVSNEKISESIEKKYQQIYKDNVISKNVYYYNAILKEIQKDKSYDRIVISEDLESFANNNFDMIDKFIFEKLESIKDEISSDNGRRIPMIIISSDRREPGDKILSKFYDISIYDALMGSDRSIDKICELLYKNRTKEEAGQYYKIFKKEKEKTMMESDVSEVEIQNILAHFKRLGDNEEKILESFNSIVPQYTDIQLRIIMKFLPLNVRGALERKSAKYQQLLTYQPQNNMQPNNMQQNNMQPNNMQQNNMQPNNMQQNNMQPNNMRPNNMNQNNVFVPPVQRTTPQQKYQPPSYDRNRNEREIERNNRMAQQNNGMQQRNMQPSPNFVNEQLNRQQKVQGQGPVIVPDGNNQVKKVYNEQAEQEKLRQEKLRQEKLRQEKLRQEKLRQEKLRQEKLRQEKLRQEKLRQEKLRQEKLRQEKLRQEKLRQEKLKQEKLRQEKLRQEKLRQEKMKQEQNHEEKKEKMKNEKVLKEVSTIENTKGTNEAPKRRGRPRKVVSPEEQQKAQNIEKRRRGRPRKNSESKEEVVKEEIQKEKKKKVTPKEHDEKIDDLDLELDGLDLDGLDLDGLNLDDIDLDDMSFETEDKKESLDDFDENEEVEGFDDFEFEDLEDEEPEDEDDFEFEDLEDEEPEDEDDFEFEDLEDEEPEDEDDFEFEDLEDEEPEDEDDFEFEDLEDEEPEDEDDFEFEDLEDEEPEDEDDLEFEDLEDEEPEDEEFEDFEEDDEELPLEDEEFEDFEEDDEELPLDDEEFEDFEEDDEELPLEDEEFEDFEEDDEELPLEDEEFEDFEEDDEELPLEDEEFEDFEEDDEELPLDDEEFEDFEEDDEELPLEGEGFEDFGEDDEELPLGEQDLDFDAEMEMPQDNNNQYQQQPVQTSIRNPLLDTTNRNANIQIIKSQTIKNYLSSSKKLAAFVGTSKNGTSFLVNSLADILARQGIKTAILDLTRSKNSYYIYTKNEETLRNAAFNSIPNLINNTAKGVTVKNNLDVYTSLPGDESMYDNYEAILTTLVQNYTVVLLDCDFNTNMNYLNEAEEIYLVQSMDVLTIQSMTAYLRELKTKGILEQSKLRIVINKFIRIRGVAEKTIVGGLAFYNDPAMTFMSELFDKEKVPYTVVPFDPAVYARYLEGLVMCEVSTSKYSKSFNESLKRLSNMIYPLLGAIQGNRK